MANRREPRLLSLDGGGVRGWSQLQLLGHLIYILHSKLNPDAQLPEDNDLFPCDYFDIVVGNGTGGITAIMIGRLGMSMSQCRRAWSQLSTVFDKINESADPNSSLFETSRLEQWAKDLVREYTGDEDTVMSVRGQQNINNKGCNVAVTSMRRRTMGLGGPALFRSYIVRNNPEANCKIWEAIRATMASPSLFDSVYIGPSEYSKQEFINAELGENNPIWSIIKEKEQFYRKEGNWPPPEIGIMVSIGCGKEEVISIETGEKQPRQGMLAHLNPFGAVDEQADSEQVLYNVMLRIAKDCERKHQDIKSRLSKEDEHKYFRLNVEQGMQRISETDWSQQNMQNITAHVNYYKDDTEVDEMMGNAAAALARLCEKPVEPQIPAWRTTLKAQPTT